MSSVSASGNSALTPDGKGFRLADTGKAMGSHGDGHRSGWPFVLSALREREDPGGLLIDDFVEKTFRPYRWAFVKRLLGRKPPPRRVWRDPWIGIFHLPPNFPDWFMPGAHPEQVFATPGFRESLPQLRGCLAFSEYHAAWLREKFGLPVRALWHPTDITPVRFDLGAFERSAEPKLVQVGWYLRNYRAIYQVPVPAPYRKVHLAQKQPFIEKAQRRTDAASPYRHRPDIGDTEVISWLPNEAYDRLLAESVMFLELADASANNAVVEAMVRETPLVVNRHPAVAEYLGAGYPLFYDRLEDVPALLDRARIREAHLYLKALDKSRLQIGTFVDAVDAFARQLRA